MKTQAEHDAWHPGKVCSTCPRTIEQQQHLRDLADRLFDRRPWWKRWFR